MGLFKKRKVEEIVLLQDKKPVEPEPIPMVTPQEPVPAASKQEVLERYRYLQRENEEIMNAYYVCNIFSFIATKDSDYGHQMKAIDKHIKRLQDLHQAVADRLIALKTMDNPAQEELEDLFDKVKEISLFHQGISNIIDDARKKYFNHLKIATLNACMNRKNIELEKIYRGLSSFLKDYKSLEEAANTIFYSSGEMIQGMVKALIQALELHRDPRYIRAYPFHYFLHSDVVITLTNAEWIDLYNKIRFVMKSASDANLSHCLEFRKYFDVFKIKYLILMMNLERSSITQKIG